MIMRYSYNKLLKLYLLLSFSLICSQLLAQEFPPINTFTPQQYNAENQNWSISQSSDKSIYVANSKGLLKYNGAKWRLYPSPNETIMRSVKAVGDRVYTGCYMEFGYWLKDAFGKLEYVSLSNSKTISLVEDEQFWQIEAFDEWILFRSLNRIYIYNIKEDTFKLIESKKKITTMFVIDQSVYFQALGDGLYKIENGAKKIFIKDEILKNTELVHMSKSNNEFLIKTKKARFYKYKNTKLRPWKISADKEMNNVTVYSSIKLQNGNFALGTISDGVLIIDQDGNLIYKINQSSGLSNNTVLSLFEDVENNIWLGLDNGINCINIKSPVSIFNDFNGELGSVYTSAIFNDFLYLGTNQGLFYKRLNTNDSFKKIKTLQGQVWFLEVINNKLFCGHDLGTFIIENNEAEQVSDVQGTWIIRQIKNKENLLLQGNYDGLNVLERKDKNWVFRNKIEGFNISSRFIEFFGNNKIMISHEYKGVYEVTISDDYTKATKVKDNSLEKGLHSSIIKYNDDIIYAYKKGVFKYDYKQGKFNRDSVLSHFFNEKNYISGRLINDSKTNKLWSFSESDISYAVPRELSSELKINKISISQNLRNSIESFENIIHLDDKKFLFGTSSGYLIVDLNKIYKNSRNISINEVVISDLDNKTFKIDRSITKDLDTKDNNIEFSFSVPEYDKFEEVKYQHQLKGLYDNWSNWTTNSTILYKNLPHGDYSFNVRAKVGNKVSSNIDTYNFTIKKPFYITNTAFLFYFLCVIIFSVLMHNLYKSYYKKQREALLSKTKRELELKELENKQQLMSFKNEKLQQENNNKSRELATSTMSLVKKNEFLNQIKAELNNVKSNSDLAEVIKIIDKNLNSTNDWKLFQEAFNSVDKDFLKKIKSIHPELTPNDLRLCAYLRLNLTSKEIAPLLNISPRSIEVKRYRLRKKMNLAHKTSLANYIMEIK